MEEIFDPKTNAYWLINPNGVKEGPLCPNNECLHDNNDQRQRLLDNRDGSYSCPQCSKHIIVDQEKWDAYGEAAARENDRRAEEFNRQFGI